MTLYQALLLGFAQGLTEFLPISSSGHLVLMQTFLDVELNTEVLQHFDIVLHAGSLIAIALYFWKTWMRILLHPFKRENDGSPPLLILLIAVSVPLGIIGFLSADWIQANTRTPLFVAFGFICTGSLLIASEKLGSRTQESIGWKQALGAGTVQVLGMLPGFSRSGMTISGGRFAGLSAVRATEFAFMLGAPALGGALLYTLSNGREALLQIDQTILLAGFCVSLLSSIAVMYFFIHTIRRYGVAVWSVYLFALAALIIGSEMLH